MPAPVVLVHNDPEFLETTKASLEAAGFVVASFSNPMLALTALETPHTVNLLITGTFFGPGQPNAVSLTRVVRSRRPNVQAVFIGEPEVEEFVDGLGVFVSAPVDPDQLLVLARLWQVGLGQCRPVH